MTKLADGLGGRMREWVKEKMIPGFVYLFSGMEWGSSDDFTKRKDWGGIICMKTRVHLGHLRFEVSYRHSNGSDELASG